MRGMVGHLARTPVVVPQRQGWRGVGVGNELLGWAKALIAADVLGGVALPPAWGLNPRGYRQLFGSSRLDVLRNAAATSAAGGHVFDEAAYRSTGVVPFDDAVRIHARRVGWDERPPRFLLTGGMWGGLAAVQRALPLVEAKLWAARDVAAHLTGIERAVPSGALRIGVHVRRGDYVAPSADLRPPADQWNAALPIDWYVAACRAVLDRLDGPAAIVVFSDGTPSDLQGFFSAFPDARPPAERTSAAADLLALSRCDLLVLSRSSFSMWAAALSSSPYLWHGPSLVDVGGALGIWDHGSPPPAVAGRTAVLARGVPFGPDDALPGELVEHLRGRQALRDVSRDLVFYGRRDRVPISADR
jgi:hypothetical protein